MLTATRNLAARARLHAEDLIDRAQNELRRCADRKTTRLLGVLDLGSRVHGSQVGVQAFEMSPRGFCHFPGISGSCSI